MNATMLTSMLALASCITAFAQGGQVLNVDELNQLRNDNPAAAAQPTPMTMAPAQWIWLPGERTLSNTFALFRKEMDLKEAPVRATGWLTADSRYLLTVNGQHVQWGPAPCDPRQLDVDPCDLTALLHAGKNVIGAEVLFYGFGDGTWPAGQARLHLPRRARISPTGIPNGSCRTPRGRSCSIGHTVRAQYKRWYLRSLQEEYDARLRPVGWDTIEFTPDAAWMPAAAIECPPDKPAACGFHESNDTIDRANPEKSALRARQIPAVREVPVPAKRLAQTGRVTWLRDPNDWFDMQIPHSFTIERADIATPQGDGWELPATAKPNEGVFATFEFTEQVVGWPYFTIDAPEGTIVELMIQEGHDVDNGPLWLDTHMHSWTRFICREGVNTFQTFDYECARWVQLHVRNASRPVVIRNVGIQRRLCSWPEMPHIVCDDPSLQRLFDATVNTFYNSAIETFVDGMGRERQQYSGDCGVQPLVAYYAFGDTRLARRYLRTFSEGQSPDGYFMDCWPAFDRLARVIAKADRRRLLGAPARSRRRVQLRLLVALPVHRRPRRAHGTLSPLAALRRVPGNLARRERTAARRRAHDSNRLDRPQRLQEDPPQTVRVQSLRVRHVQECARAHLPRHERCGQGGPFRRTQRQPASGHGRALLERGTRPLRSEPPVAGRRRRSAAVRPVAGHLDPLRPMSGQQHRRGA